MTTITVIHPCEVPADKVDQALAILEKAAGYFRRQPGFISGKLHRSVEDGAKYTLVTVAEWASADHFKKALSGEELKAAAAGLEEFSHHPSLYQVARAYENQRT